MTGGEPKEKKHKKSGKKDSKKSGPHEIRVRHGASGGYIAEHHSKKAKAGDGSCPSCGQSTEPDAEHVIPDLDELQSHMQDNMAEQAPASSPDAAAASAAAAPPPAGAPPPTPAA